MVRKWVRMEHAVRVVNGRGRYAKSRAIASSQALKPHRLRGYGARDIGSMRLTI